MTADVDISVIRLAEAIVPANEVRRHWLHPQEAARWERIKSARRRQQWWAGRWWMKRHILTRLNLSIAPCKLWIESSDARDFGIAPRVRFNGMTLPVMLSLSHSGEHIAVAIGDRTNGSEPAEYTFGIDLVDPPAFNDRSLAGWFSRAELFADGDEGQFKGAWAAKEAAFKTLVGQSFQPRLIVLQPLAMDVWRWSYMNCAFIAKGDVSLRRHSRFYLAFARRLDHYSN